MRDKILLVFTIMMASLISVDAQYFGQNKPRYRTFDFKVKQTEHFDIYSYLKNPEMLKKLALQTEGWYNMHSRIFKDTFERRNPIIFYSNHADFQQTNAISGAVGIGTGGVTEGLKNRVIMPVTFTTQQTNHVLGHELVHAFQYHKIIEGDSTSLQSLQNLPLWMVEGLAEYMSKGKTDTYTAMWIRDAVINDDIPALKDLRKPEYFPYRYGQAFWSFISGLYGDGVIEPLFMETGKYGLEVASELVLGTSLKNLNSQWENGIANHYAEYVRDKKENFEGKKVISKENAGKMNVSPALSPNGKYVIFLSEKDVFSTDLFLADARSGKIIRRITSTVKESHIDDINFLESAGTWSPDSKDFAYVAFSKGANILVIKEAESGKKIESSKIKGLPAFTNPAWHPNGKEIILTGLVEGQTDLYSYNIRRKKATKITDDVYSEIQANLNEEGTKLVFATDENSVKNGTTNGKFTFDIAIRDLEDGTTEILNVFRGANNLNPNFDHEGNVLFLSDRDGYRNMYKYVVSSGEVLKMTDFIVGLSGITEYSPAIAVSRKVDRVLMTNYNDHTYNIYQAQGSKLLNIPVDPSEVNFEAGTLPIISTKVDRVNTQLSVMDKALSVSELKTYKNAKYKPQFKLDYLGGGTGIAVGNSTFGNYTGLAGGIDMLFGDILGNNQIFAQASLNGEIYDAGGRVSYINRKHKLAYGLGIAHVPLRTGYQSFEFNENLSEPAPNGFAYNVKQLTNLLRIFDDGVNAFVHLPFSKSLRLEGGVELNYRSFRNDLYTSYLQYDQLRGYSQEVYRDREKIPTGDVIAFDQYFRLVKGWKQSSNIALVGDNSNFGLTSPLKGYRFRLGAEQHFGTDDYISLLADGRYYKWFKPVSFAVRGFAYSRFEQDVNSQYPFYIGQMGFVRGYGSLFNGASDLLNQYDIAFGQVLGTKVLMGSGEVRLPFTGPKGLSLIASKYLISDLALFYDAGVTFDQFSHFQDGEEMVVTRINSDGQPQNVSEFRKPALLMSAGVSLRVNLFGYIIVEPYYAIPIVKGQDGIKGTFGLNLIPGW